MVIERAVSDADDRQSVDGVGNRHYLAARFVFSDIGETAVSRDSDPAVIGRVKEFGLRPGGQSQKKMKQHQPRGASKPEVRRRGFTLFFCILDALILNGK